MLRQIRSALVVLLIMSLITGVAYPLLVTGVAQLVFAKEANGSIVVRNGQAVGSVLIGQNFDAPKYFWGRPSATGPLPYTAFNAEKLTGSSGSNYGPTNSALTDAVKARIDALRAIDSTNDRPVPVDLVTASGSGLDLQISPAAAEYQAARVAKARGLPEPRVRELVSLHTTPRSFGVLGEPRINVLELNLALDRESQP